ncbi:MAG TPA: PA2169 family four-helix-bundle protein [Pyrinomonadaceae bacterium]|nr:PA2169 family four-helix-bundle protein [Pyrinomonadaceae bacterium]
MINDYEAVEPMTSQHMPVSPSDGSAATQSLSNDDTIGVLNNLIETCRDGQEGFKDAAEAVQDSQLKTLFYEYSQQRAQFSAVLQELVRELGGDPANSGSTAGALHRGWIELKSAITGGSDEAILNECERGEDSAKDNYKDALEKNLPANIADVIRQQSQAVQAAHNRVRELRNAESRAANS